LEGRKIIFQGCGGNIRSLILKEKISDKVLKVFVLFLLILNIILFYLCFYVLQEDKI
jgi:predicted permease